jgi:hypothetical protein
MLLALSRGGIEGSSMVFQFPVAGANYNITEENVRKNSQQESFQGNKSSSSDCFCAY